MLIYATQLSLPAINPVKIAQGHTTILTFPLGILSTPPAVYMHHFLQGFGK